VSLFRPASAPILAAGLLTAGCVGGPGGPAPGALAYGTPDPNPIALTFSDSTLFTIEAPGYGAMEMASSHTGTVELRFKRERSGYEVDVRFTDLAGGLSTPAQGGTRVDETDVGGRVGLELSYTGDLVVVDTPAVTAALAEVAGLDGLLRPLFPRLPGRPVMVGARWVDTVRTREAMAGTVWRDRRIVVSTLMGDTLAAGRRLLRIAVAVETEVEVEGISGGVAVHQRLAGILHGRVLWDDQAHVLVESTEAGELTGTLEMPETGVAAMPVTATVWRRVMIRP